MFPPPPEGKGYGNITVKGEANLYADNIAKGKSLFGITGIYPRPEDLAVVYASPEAENKFYNIPEGYAGIKEVRVRGDDNLKSENILNGVNIFNTIGNYRVNSQYNVKYTENDVFYVDPPTNYSAMKRVRVTVDVPQRGMVKETINAVINANGNYTYTPSINATYQGLGLVNVRVNVPQYVNALNASLKTKTVNITSLPITLNAASEGCDGYSLVKIQSDGSLAKWKIKEGETIFGVTGNYAGVVNATFKNSITVYTKNT